MRENPIARSPAYPRLAGKLLLGPPVLQDTALNLTPLQNLALHEALPHRPDYSFYA
jgi:hypothetical protein